MRHAPHSARADGQSEENVHSRVQHHQLRYPLDGVHGALVGKLVTSAALLGEQL